MATPAIDAICDEAAPAMLTTEIVFPKFTLTYARVPAGLNAARRGKSVLEVGFTGTSATIDIVDVLMTRRTSSNERHTSSVEPSGDSAMPLNSLSQVVQEEESHRPNL